MFAKAVKGVMTEPYLPVEYSKLSSYRRVEVRLAYIKRQKGLCMYCHEKLTDMPSIEVRNAKINYLLFPKHFFEYPVHLHHDHKTDMTIGAVHCRCNAVMWEYEDE